MKKRILISMIIAMVLASCTQKYPFKLGDNYVLDYDGNSFLFIVNEQGTIMVNSHIRGFDFDSTYLIVEQKPVELILKETYNNSESNLEKRKKIFEESSLRQYWIIDKSKESIFNESTKTYSNVFGPYSKEEYLQKRKELGVPEELKLKE